MQLTSHILAFPLLLICCKSVFGDKNQLIAKIDIPYNRRYLLENQESPRDFITCLGQSPTGRDNASFRVDLYLYYGGNSKTPSATVHITNKISPRFDFDCTPPIPIKISDCIVASQVTCRFGVHPATTEESGKYNCQASACPAHPLKGGSDELIVGVYDHVILNSAYLNEPSSDIYIGTSFTLRCEVSYTKDMADLNFQWRRGSVTVKTITATSLSKSRSDPYSYFDYVVENATKTDSGSYVCVCVPNPNVAYYIDLQPRQQIKVDVRYDAVIESFASSPFNANNDSIVNVFSNGATDTLVCAADGSPDPNITLTLNGSPVPHTVSRDNTITKMLALPKVGRDDGEYCCQAVNFINSEEKKAVSCLKVKVYAFPEVDTFGPEEKNSSCLFKEQSVELTCHSSGLPRPRVSILSVNMTLLATGNGSAVYNFYTGRKTNLTFLCQAVNQWRTTSRWQNFALCSSDENGSYIVLPLGCSALGVFVLLATIFLLYKTWSKKSGEKRGLLKDYQKQQKIAKVNQLAKCLKHHWTDVAQKIVKEYDVQNIRRRLKEREDERNFDELCARMFLREWMEEDNAALPRVVYNVLVDEEYQSTANEVQQLFPDLDSWAKDPPEMRRRTGSVVI